MKRILLLIIILGWIFSTQAQTALPQKISKLGLIAELAFIKMSAENFMIPIFEDTTIKKEHRQELIKIYLSLRSIQDQILLQLIADNINCNSVKKFRRINSALAKYEIFSMNELDARTKARPYVRALKTSNSKLTDLFNYNYRPTPLTQNEQEISLEIKINAFLPATATVEEITGAVELVNTVIKDIREAKGKKVDGINDILNDLRLSSIQEIATAKNDDKVDKEKKAKKDNVK